MKTLKIIKKHSEKKQEHTLEVRGHNFLYVLFTNSKKDTDSKAAAIQEVINYYEFGKLDEDLELLERTKTPSYTFFTVLSKKSKSKDNLRSVRLIKETNKYNCTCDHGALHSVNNNEICKHIKHCIKIEALHKLHEDNNK